MMKSMSFFADSATDGGLQSRQEDGLTIIEQEEVAKQKVGDKSLIAKQAQFASPLNEYWIN